MTQSASQQVAGDFREMRSDSLRMSKQLAAASKRFSSLVTENLKKAATKKTVHTRAHSIAVTIKKDKLEHNASMH